MSTDLKKQFNDLSKSLMELHRALLMLEAKKIEQAEGRKLNPYELLNASLQDPGLAWLRVISHLIVNIDTIIDETPQLSNQDANRVTAEVLAALDKPPGLISTDFWTHYTEYLGSNPDIIMMHSKVKSLLDTLRPTN